MNPLSSTLRGCLFIVASCLALASTAMAQSDTVKLILIDGDMREDWPANGRVAFHRESDVGDLTVNFAITGTATRGTDYSMPAGNMITIPNGDREAWLEFTPLPDALNEPNESIIVNLQTGTGYIPTATTTLRTAKLTLGNASSKPCAKAAVRFMYQAAFGPDADSPADVDLIPQNAQTVMTMGFDNWITDQFARPIGTVTPYLNYADKLAHKRNSTVQSRDKLISWWNRVMGLPSLAPGGKAQLPDPLRQRVAFAWSEIFVISDHLERLAGQPLGMGNYYDMLLKGSFGNFRDLLYNVATHPCMGVYLSHLNNAKADPDLGTHPDENFAREIMQLFSIGLWELNPDGTQKLDNFGVPIPTYNIDTITHMARVMTGFSWGDPKGAYFGNYDGSFVLPMRMWDEAHDLEPKVLLNGVTLPARTASSNPDTGAAGMLDFNAAIDCLFNHPTTAPFICKQLIQKLVTSNPTPAYVARVSAKFINNGRGVRGDLQAVVRAILMDNEARDPAMLSSTTFGKVKEPYLRTVSLARALNAKSASGVYDMNYYLDPHLQTPQSAPNVFNFFRPGYSPAGQINDAGLVGPEFQIINDVSALALPNFYLDGLQSNGLNLAAGKDSITLQTAAELALVTDVPALLRRLDMMLTGGTLPNVQHQIIREAVEAITPSMYDWRNQRLQMALSLIISAPEFGIQR